MNGPHSSHNTRISDASSFDEICDLCGATDYIGGWGKLAEPCPAYEFHKTHDEQDACPCRGTNSQEKCAMAGCGFCCIMESIEERGFL